MTIYLTEPEVLVDFVDGLKRSAGCAHALAHYQQNPQWLSIRDLLESLIEKGQKLAVAKSIPRYQVEEMITERKEDVNRKVNSGELN